MTDPELIKQRLAAARQELSALCKGRRFTMSIPAQPDYDSDLLIGATLRDTHALLEEVEQLQKAVVGLLWGCENAGMRPYPAYDDARRALGSCDPLRFIRGPVDEEEVPDADRP